MRLLAAIVLVGSVLACGSRADLTGSPPDKFDAAPARDSATAQPSVAVDATASDAVATYDPAVTHGPDPVQQCAGGCLCFSASSCPAGCYLTVRNEGEPSASAPFCANGIVTCGAGWAIGTPVDNCGDGRPRYLDAGPDGAFCCER